MIYIVDNGSRVYNQVHFVETEANKHEFMYLLVIMNMGRASHFEYTVVGVVDTDINWVSDDARFRTLTPRQFSNIYKSTWSGRALDVERQLRLLRVNGIKAMARAVGDEE